MRIGLAYNEKPDPRAVASDEPPSSSDAYAEWDEPSTITAVEQALGLFGRVVRLEADALFPQKLALARPDLVFNMAEGLDGPNREAHVPAICEFLNVPYTGSDPLTLAIAILGNGAEARCLPVVGFDFSTLPAGTVPVYGYEAKWIWDTAEHPIEIFHCPARVEPSLRRLIEQTALDAYHAIGCRDWCRVDVRLDRFGVPNIVELNPLPGIIPDPRMNS